MGLKPFILYLEFVNALYTVTEKKVDSKYAPAFFRSGGACSNIVTISRLLKLVSLRRIDELTQLALGLILKRRHF